MKRFFAFTKRDTGFVLPYVLVIVTIVLIIMTANINIYEQEVKMTHHYLEHIKIETLMQMAYDQFHEEHDINEISKKQMVYEFRLGSVDVTFTPAKDEPNKLYFVVNTDQGTRYTFFKRVKVTEK